MRALRGVHRHRYRQAPPYLGVHRQDRCPLVQGPRTSLAPRAIEATITAWSHVLLAVGCHDTRARKHWPASAVWCYVCAATSKSCATRKSTPSISSIAESQAPKRRSDLEPNFPSRASPNRFWDIRRKKKCAFHKPKNEVSGFRDLKSDTQHAKSSNSEHHKKRPKGQQIQQY